MRQAEPAQPSLPFGELPADAGRGSLDIARAGRVNRWLHLVREVLPGMSAECNWSISQDHCFMRVCLDASLGRPWDTVVKRPAIKHLSTGQLEAVIAVAESIVTTPSILTELNRQSIRMRQGGAPDR